MVRVFVSKSMDTLLTNNGGITAVAAEGWIMDKKDRRKMTNKNFPVRDFLDACIGYPLNLNK
jgi:hypothetical protein